MSHELFSMALQRVLRKKRSSLLVFFVLLISFSFAILSLSLMGSISETNAQFRLDTYGAWYFAIPSGVEADAQWLAEKDWAETVGTAYNCGTVNGSIGFGAVDETLREMGRLTIDEGRWPAADNEIVLEMDALSELGYDYTLGQEITLQIRVPWGKRTVTVEQSYTLCGILHEYSDLWVLERNTDHRLLVSAVVTQAAAEQVLQAAREQAQGVWEKEEAKRKEAAEEEEAQLPLPETIAALPQYFITIPEDLEEVYLESAEFQLERWLRSDQRNGKLAAANYSQNATAYEQGWSRKQNDAYLYLVTAVTLAAVLCVYLMQLPDELHSLATLRSIGITKPQLALLLLDETLILCVPAIAAGLPCGAGATYLALKLVVFAGSVTPHVVVPYVSLLSVILLWAAAVLFSRFIIFIIAVRMPLTGRLRLHNGSARRIGLARSGLIFVLLAAFGVVAVFPWPESLHSLYIKAYYEQQPSYRLSAAPEWLSPEEGFLRKSVPPEEREWLEKVPDIIQVYGEGDLDAGLSFPGQEETMVNLYALNEEEWAGILDFGERAAAFHDGSAVCLAVPERIYDSELQWEVPWEQTGRPLPEGSVTLRLYAGSKYDTMLQEAPAEEDARALLLQTSADVFVYRIPPRANNRGLIWSDDYVVLCSEAYLRKLLALLPAGEHWGTYTGGEGFGYSVLCAVADPYSSGLSTDTLIAELCKQHEIDLWNARQRYASVVQERLQDIILLYASGGCVALIVLLILASALSLEAEQEKQSFRILRAIGMSARQMWARVFGKALVRSLAAVLCGWLLYGGYLVLPWLRSGRADSVAGALREILREWSEYGFGLWPLGAITAACFAVVLIVSLLAKRKLGQSF